MQIAPPLRFCHTGTKRSVLWPSKYAKIRFRRGSAPNPARGAPPGPLVGWEGTPLPMPHLTWHWPTCVTRHASAQNSSQIYAYACMHRPMMMMMMMMITHLRVFILMCEVTFSLVCGRCGCRRCSTTVWCLLCACCPGNRLLLHRILPATASAPWRMIAHHNVYRLLCNGPTGWFVAMIFRRQLRNERYFNFRTN